MLGFGIKISPRQISSLLVSCLALAVAAEAAAGDVGSAKAWPTHYDAAAAGWDEGAVADGFAYQTHSYLIISQREIGHGRVSEMATVAESVHEVLGLFPLQLLPAADRRAHRRHIVRILPTQKDYIAAGGAEGTVGFYNGRTREVLVSLERLVEPKGHRSNLEPRQRYRLLVHELVHQAMGERLHLLPTWFTEGIAEYFAATQFAPGRYKFENCSRAIIDHLNAVWLHDRRRAVTLPEVRTLIAMPAATWAADNRRSPEIAYAKYAGSLLLAHYQLELASRGIGALGEFLETGPEHTRVPGERRRFRVRTPDQKLLWEDRPPDAVQRGLTKYWKSKGLGLRFAPMRGEP